MILLSRPSLDHVVRHTAYALSTAGVLGEFWTCRSGNGRAVPERVAPDSLFHRAPGFSGLISPPPRRCNAVEEAFPRVALASSLDHAMSMRIEEECFRGVYAYEHAAEATFRAAGRHGLLRIYDLPGGHGRAHDEILHEEAVLQPEWASTLGLSGHAACGHERTESELQQADLILVGSSYGMQTVEEIPDLTGTIALIPPAAPMAPSRHAASHAPSSDRLRVLFAGPLSQRSGLSYLFAANRELASCIDLTVIGDLPASDCHCLERELEHVRWRPRCHEEELLREMSAHDVFLFPALCDGNPARLLAALASGLPIIATSHTAAPDLIRDGQEGFIIPLRSTEAIVEKLVLLQREPERRREMAKRARARAGTFTWANYESQLAASVKSALAQR